MTIAITPHETPGAVGDEYTPTAIDLRPFCAEPDDYREFLRHPWHERGVTYASNGAAICAIPGVHADVELEKNGANLVAASPSLIWHPIEALAIDWREIPAYTRSFVCDACWKTGKAVCTPCDSCDCNAPQECPDSELKPHDTAVCPHCRGHGMTYPQHSAYITDPLFDGSVFQSHLLRPFIEQFTDIEFAMSASMPTRFKPVAAHSGLRLRFREGVGAIMPACPANEPVIGGGSHAM